MAMDDLYSIRILDPISSSNGLDQLGISTLPSYTFDKVRIYGNSGETPLCFCNRPLITSYVIGDVILPDVMVSTKPLSSLPTIYQILLKYQKVSFDLGRHKIIQEVEEMMKNVYESYILWAQKICIQVKRGVVDFLSRRD